MFQPETEDMLPRIAPKPTTGPGLNEPTAMPTVPEISILFNQQNPTSGDVCTTIETHQCKPQQSYASWKKSVLPKVIYPASTENVSSTQSKVTQSSQNYPIDLHSNVFPLRAAPPKNLHYSTNSYRRSVESCVPSFNPTADIQVFDSAKPMVTQQHQQQQMRCSSDALPQQAITTPLTPIAQTRTYHSEVLTICAGTQTEPYSFRTNTVEDNHQQQLGTLVTKKDLANLIEHMEGMHEEQQRLTRICSVLLEKLFQDSTQNKLKTILRDASTQCDTNGNDVVKESGANKGSQDTYNGNQEYVAEVRAALYHRMASDQDALSPRPAAHSTKYRQSTPQSAYKKQGLQQQLTQHNKVLSIPATEQSLVMNELALKYLPNNKLTELMQELQMSLSTNQKTSANFNGNLGKLSTTPLRNIDNFDRGPNELSNASYKYLKKYRLLPEVPQIEHITANSPCKQHNNNYQCDQSPRSGSQSLSQENILDLDAIKKQPKFL